MPLQSADEGNGLRISSHECICRNHIAIVLPSMMIDEELHALIFMTNLPLSWETFVSMVFITSSTGMAYRKCDGIVFHYVYAMNEANVAKLVCAIGIKLFRGSYLCHDWL